MITVTTLVRNSPQKVWKYWTEPFHITKWNAASDDWHTPHAENDLRPGGRFTSRMEAKDGSMGFDFTGIYDQVIIHHLIEYTMEDGRKARVEFSDENGHTRIIESFEPESMNSHELQQQGWQAILDNFSKYAESLSLKKIKFEYFINASPEKVYRLMLAPESYKKWTAAFNPGSHFRGSWDEGSSIHFIGTDEQGNEGGMVSRIQKNIPAECVCIEHLGMLLDGKEILEGPEIELWAGVLECYYFLPNGSGTTLKVEMDTIQSYEAYFSETWPKALEILKQLCEQE
jgi:uncharacterized protein YndB with AHSA1/START domain